MINNQHKLNAILSLIYDNNYTNELILMGSWNEYFYVKLYKEFESYMATQDLDFYCINRNKEKNDKDLYNILIENGFVCLHDTYNNKTTFVDDDFEIEFLYKNTRELETTTKINRLGVVAECLNGLDNIEKFYITYHDNIYNYDVNILKPSYYCLQKIVINEDRTIEKKEKDKISINNLLGLIINREDLKDDFKNAVNCLNRKQLAKYKKNVISLGIIDAVESIMYGRS